jgi:protein-tyrosine phosphatase
MVGCPAGSDPPIETVVALDGEPGRWVILDGANNTRDIGGYGTEDGRVIRRGLVYRSGELSALSPAGCQAFADLGVRRVVDFRNRLAPSPLFGGDAVCVFEVSAMSLLPVINEPTEVPEKRYIQAVVDNAASYRQAFELIGDPENLPLLYHCAAGKDRTGIMTVLLLRLLGVDRDTIVADYELSDLVAPPVSTGCVLELLDEIDRQGGIETYLDNIGVTEAAQGSIRDQLLE